MTMGGRWGALLPIEGIVLSFSSGARAQSCEPASARVISVQGNVDVSDSDRAHWRDVQLNQVLCAGQQVRLMAKSRAVLQLPNETPIHLDEGSVITLRAIEPEKPAWLDSVVEPGSGVLGIETRAFGIDSLIVWDSFTMKPMDFGKITT